MDEHFKTKRNSYKYSTSIEEDTSRFELKDLPYFFCSALSKWKYCDKISSLVP